MKAFIIENVDSRAILNTDDNAAYDTIGKQFAKHDVVNHSEKEYSRRETDGRVATTNTAEGFSLIKRGVY